MKKTTRKDAGERIAERCIKMARAGAWVTGQTNLAKDIRRSLNRAVKEERDRCLAIMKKHQKIRSWPSASAIVDEIRTTKGK